MTSLVRATCEGSAPKGRIFRITQPYGLRIRHLGTHPIHARGQIQHMFRRLFEKPMFCSDQGEIQDLFYSLSSGIRGSLIK
jgi:hypothetical protein